MPGDLRAPLAALLTALLMTAPCVFAAERSEGNAPAEQTWQPALLDLSLNAVAEEAPVLALIGGGDVLLPLEVMVKLRLAAAGGRRLLVDGKPWISLGSLRAEVTFELDERALALRLMANPRLLGKSTFDLAAGKRPDGMLARGDRSAFLNYSAQGRSDAQGALFFEAGGSAGSALFTSGLARQFDGSWARGLTSFTLDQPAFLRRWTAGEAGASGGALGGAAVVAGLSVAREFALDPYFIRGPLPRTNGFATTPSQVDVYVNGVLVKEQQVAPGAFELSHLPVTTGNGTIRTVIRDAFGRTEELDARYYYSSGLLSKGLSDYAYHLGFVRNQFGVRSFDFSGPVLLGRHRVGLTDQTTAGLRLEAGLDRVSAGGSVTTALPFGELEGAAGVSGQGPDRGGAGSLGWAYRSGRWNGGVFLRGQSDRYATVSLSGADDRATFQGGAFLGLPAASRMTVNLEVASGHYRESGSSDSVAVRTDFRLGQAASLFLTGAYGRSAGGGAGFNAFATLMWALPGAASADMSIDSSSGGGGSAGIQRGLPMGEGYGYRVRGGAQAGLGQATGVFQYQGPYGRYEAQFDQTGRGALGTASVSGGLVSMDGRLFATRPMQDGFALIQVPGVSGVRGYLNNQEIGRTDPNGNLLVPNLQAYYGNKLSIRGSDVPMTYDVGRTDMVLAPPVRGGAVARFEVAPIQGVSGDILIDGKATAERPSYGEMTVRGGGEGTVTSPLAQDGHFFFERLPPGSHEAEVEYGGGRCTARLEVPVSTALVVELGTVHCGVGAGQVVAGRIFGPDPIP